MKFSLPIVLAAALCASQPAFAQDAAKTPAACPAALPAGTNCYSGQDANGALWLAAIPQNWNQVLVVHAHGGPETGAPELRRSAQDLTRWAVTVQAGYAWVGSTYRRGGYGVRMAAEDTENLRQIFVAEFGQPRLTILHGQSWGGNVAAKVLEMYPVKSGAVTRYDGALMSNGLLSGGSRGYDFRLDLRAVYQYYCGNHPRPGEAQYPLWMGLPAGVTMTRADLQSRLTECTGLGLPAAERSAEQRHKLAQILNVLHLQEGALAGHLQWATFLFADMVGQRLHGRNPFSNQGVVYAGSDDDAALNAGVLRYRSDPLAVRELAEDSDPAGHIGIPVLTVHGINDPTVFVELEEVYRKAVEGAGNGDRLVQTFTNEGVHSYLSSPEYTALFSALLGWIERGEKPTARSVAARCAADSAQFSGGCHFNLDYRPRDVAGKVYSREK